MSELDVDKSVVEIYQEVRYDHESLAPRVVTCMTTDGDPFGMIQKPMVAFDGTHYRVTVEFVCKSVAFHAITPQESEDA